MTRNSSQSLGKSNQKGKFSIIHLKIINDKIIENQMSKSDSKVRYTYYLDHKRQRSQTGSHNPQAKSQRAYKCQKNQQPTLYSEEDASTNKPSIDGSRLLKSKKCITILLIVFGIYLAWFLSSCLNQEGLDETSERINRCYIQYASSSCTDDASSDQCIQLTQCILYNKIPKAMMNNQKATTFAEDLWILLTPFGGFLVKVFAQYFLTKHRNRQKGIE